ncbi:HIT family protein [Bifidobacterium choloepi]|uniref:HIT domain-containing protein n=1 Tax=Bifidobacterium choloepi TaxID=2614131 RepID=A0A6I5N5Q4_9BIFI|nr:HIT domain-containing protein [Bifidobacterium choloepi]NEG69101.1 HIT domain-containing protein [Bifidobacterium choloepi]
MADEHVVVEDPGNFPPPEDTVERLWAPQRMSYVLRDTEGHVDKPKAKECPFCAGPKKDDAEGLVAWRGTYVFAIMNLYPYNVGHMMVCPYRHVGLITELDDSELFEFEKATTLAMAVMGHVSHPDGYNIGINQGEAGGAGVATHLHQHIVPRWNGDSNFMPIVAQTRAMPILLDDQRRAYAAEFEKLAPSFGLPLRGTVSIDL